MTLGAEGKQKGLEIFRRQKYTGNKHFKGKVVASRIDLNTQSGDLFFMLLIKRRDPFCPLLSPSLRSLVPRREKDEMRLRCPVSNGCPSSATAMNAGCWMDQFKPFTRRIQKKWDNLPSLHLVQEKGKKRTISLKVQSL